MSKFKQFLSLEDGGEVEVEVEVKTEGEVEIVVDTTDDEEVEVTVTPKDEDAPVEVEVEVTEDDGDAVVEVVEGGGDTEELGEEVEELGEELEETISQEGFLGGLVGFLAGTITWSPFVGSAVHATAKVQRLKLRKDIETIAKRIAKVRAGDIKEAKEKGLDLPKNIANEDIDWLDIAKSALFGQFFGPFYGAHQGSEIENLNKQLKAKLAELEKEMEKAGISVETYHEFEIKTGEDGVPSLERINVDVAPSAPSVTEAASVIEEGSVILGAVEGYIEVLSHGLESKDYSPQFAYALSLAMESYRDLVGDTLDLPSLEDYSSNELAGYYQVSLEALKVFNVRIENMVSAAKRVVEGY